MQFSEVAYCLTTRRKNHCSGLYVADVHIATAAKLLGVGGTKLFRLNLVRGGNETSLKLTKPRFVEGIERFLRCSEFSMTSANNNRTSVIK